jgi:hypothetical protein
MYSDAAGSIEGANRRALIDGKSAWAGSASAKRTATMTGERIQRLMREGD